MCSGSVGVARKVNQFVWFIIFQVREQIHPLDLPHDRWWYIWHNFHLLPCLGLILFGIIPRHENSQVIPLGGTIWLCKFTFTFLLSPQSKHLFYALTYYRSLLLILHNTVRIFQHLNDTKHTLYYVPSNKIALYGRQSMSLIIFSILSAFILYLSTPIFHLVAYFPSSFRISSIIRPILQVICPLH